MLFFTKRKYFICKYFVNFTDLLTRRCRKRFILIVKIYYALYNVYFLLFIFFCSVCKYCINVIIIPNIPYWMEWMIVVFLFASVEWPFGTYTLVKPKSGCPPGWLEGWRKQDNEDIHNRNSLTYGHHFYG